MISFSATVNATLATAVLERRILHRKPPHRDTTMALAEEDLQQIGEYVKRHIGDWIAEQSLGKPPVVYEIELRERMVRVEEALCVNLSPGTEGVG